MYILCIHSSMYACMYMREQKYFLNFLTRSCIHSQYVYEYIETELIYICSVSITYSYAYQKRVQLRVRKHFCPHVYIAYMNNDKLIYLQIACLVPIPSDIFEYNLSYGFFWILLDSSAFYGFTRYTSK